MTIARLPYRRTLEWVPRYCSRNLIGPGKRSLGAETTALGGVKVHSRTNHSPLPPLGGGFLNNTLVDPRDQTLPWGVIDLPLAE